MTTTGLPVTDVGGERGSLFVVGRQAIYDASMAVHGYELLYRGEEGQRPSGRQMTAEVLVHAGLDLGLWGLTMGKPAFVNATRAFLVGELQVPFSPNQVVIEVLGDVPRDAEVLKGCRRLAQKGYTLAIDDYLWGPEDDPLLELAPVVKLDVLALSLAELRAAVRRCSAHGVRLAAKKVETDAQLRQYRGLGFQMFQGYFLARPQAIAGRAFSPSEGVCQRASQQMADPLVPFSEVVRTIGGDLALSYRFVQAASAGVTRRGFGRVKSVEEALEVLGERRVRAWFDLMATARAPEGCRQLPTPAMAQTRSGPRGTGIGDSRRAECRQAGISVQ